MSLRLVFSHGVQSWCALLKMKHVKNTADVMIHNTAQVIGLYGRLHGACWFGKHLLSKPDICSVVLVRDESECSCY